VKERGVSFSLFLIKKLASFLETLVFFSLNLTNFTPKKNIGNFSQLFGYYKIEKKNPPYQCEWNGNNKIK
jgi:hypothetical protein